MLAVTDRTADPFFSPQPTITRIEIQDPFLIDFADIEGVDMAALPAVVRPNKRRPASDGPGITRLRGHQTNCRPAVIDRRVPIDAILKTDISRLGGDDLQGARSQIGAHVLGLWPEYGRVGRFVRAGE